MNPTSEFSPSFRLTAPRRELAGKGSNCRKAALLNFPGCPSACPTRRAPARSGCVSQYLSRGERVWLTMRPNGGDHHWQEDQTPFSEQPSRAIH
jgi:hypothetical protein